MVRSAVCLWSAIAMLTAGFAGQADAGLFKKKCCGGCEPAPCGCDAAPACDARGGAPAGCSDCAAEAAPAPTTVMKTIMVPTYVTEMRTVTATEYKKEERTKTYTVNKRVPVTEEKTCTYTVMVPKTETKTVTYDVCKPVWETKTREICDRECNAVGKSKNRGSCRIV